MRTDFAKKIKKTRVIDHLVLPVADISIAISRYEKIGFTVSPIEKYPLGIKSCCVFFSDNTFLEFLAIDHRKTYEMHAYQGNTFIRNDQAYRFRCGEKGVSHMVIKSNDASQDDIIYRKAGISGGPNVHFERVFTSSFFSQKKELEKVEFFLSFAQDIRSPDSSFFSCEIKSERIHNPFVLKSHKNHILGLKEIVLSESNPADFQYFFQTYLGQREMKADSFGLSFHADNGVVRILTPIGLKRLYGLEITRRSRGLRFELAVLISEKLEKTKEWFNKEKIHYDEYNNHLCINALPGQGFPLIIKKVNNYDSK
ncbi:VOC family protein [Candidatus Endowatersipora endosymbiont of Watersipora subatra]|uniref:VOC family protein n=1 Tax=Candidatus Endowatersipora endosymbiont of Watersipora subatra TaxID=3077946 RepID=UPI00312C8989